MLRLKTICTASKYGLSLPSINFSKTNLLNIPSRNFCQASKTDDKSSKSKILSQDFHQSANATKQLDQAHLENLFQNTRTSIDELHKSMKEADEELKKELDSQLHKHDSNKSIHDSFDHKHTSEKNEKSTKDSDEAVHKMQSEVSDRHPPERKNLGDIEKTIPKEAELLIHPIKTKDLDHHPAKAKKLTLYEKVKEALIHAWYFTKNGLMDAFRNTKLLISIWFKKIAGIELTTTEKIRYPVQIIEQIKFLPYIFFIVIPLAELLIPFYLFFFPKGTPRYFWSKETLDSHQHKVFESQEKAWFVLQNFLKNNIDVDFSKIPALVEKAGGGDLAAVEELNKFDQEFIKKLQKNWIFYKHKLSKSNLDINIIEAAFKFFAIDLPTGHTWIGRFKGLPNRIANLFFWITRSEKRFIVNENVGENIFYDYFRKMYLVFFTNKHIVSIIRQDKSIVKGNFQAEKKELDTYDIFYLTRMRAIFGLEDNDSLNVYEKQWLKINQFKPFQILWIQVARRPYARYLNIN